MCLVELFCRPLNWNIILNIDYLPSDSNDEASCCANLLVLETYLWESLSCLAHWFYNLTFWNFLQNKRCIKLYTEYILPINHAYSLVSQIVQKVFVFLWRGLSHWSLYKTSYYGGSHQPLQQNSRPPFVIQFVLRVRYSVRSYNCDNWPWNHQITIELVWKFHHISLTTLPNLYLLLFCFLFLFFLFSLFFSFLLFLFFSFFLLFVKPGSNTWSHKLSYLVNSD